MAHLNAGTVWDLATAALQGQGFDEGTARSIAEEFVVAELTGTKTHGLGKLVSLNLGNLNAVPDIVHTGSIISVNGNGINGFLLFRQLTQLLIEKSKSNGIAAVFARNFSRYSSLYPYTSEVAKSGKIAILLNSAGPAAVAPFGSIDPITGTNPICFSFPRIDSTAQTFDFATADIVWGAIRQSAIEGVPLPFGSFLDSTGDVTVKPSDVNAVKAFGGKKGWALNLAVELLAGALSGGKVGLSCESEFDCGAMFVAIDPNFAGSSKEQFQASMEELFVSIRSSRPADPDVPVRVPGDAGRNAKSVAENFDQEVELAETVVQMLKRMAAGESIAELAANPLFN